MKPAVNFLLGWIFLVCLIYPSASLAQPGWYDMTRYFGYTILDESGQEIEFKRNKKYTVRIDSVLYTGKTIPQDKFKRVIPNDNNFEDRITINDITLVRPLNYQKHTVKIQIIRGADTLFLNNPEGLVRVLEFIPGYYYFPKELESLNTNLPNVSGDVTILNIDQRNFRIPKALFESIDYYRGRENPTHELAKTTVINKFINGHLWVRNKIESTAINPSLKPFNRPYWDSPFYPTLDSNLFLGLVTYHLDTMNLSASQGILSVFNKSQNSIQHWMPKELPHELTTVKVYYNTATKTFYNSTIIRESPCKLTTYYNCPNQWNYYRSKDGVNWDLDSDFTALHQEIEFREFEFLDEDDAVAFTRRKRKDGKYDYQQGTYYLIKNMKIYDSLQTPAGVHYNSNYEHYAFNRTADEVLLGQWGVTSRTPYGEKYYQPVLVGKNGNWKFSVSEREHERRERKEPEQNNYRVFQNFYLMNGREMVFKNGAGSLFLKKNVSYAANDIYSNIHILEKDSQIYILDSQYTLISFDKGSSWTIYPKPLNTRNRYDFLEIDDQNEISFFDLAYNYQEPMIKVKYHFTAQ